MSYLYTGTSQASGVQTGLSTQILIKVEGEAVGAVQSLTINQNRGLKRIQEVGTDGTIEIVPNTATTYSGRVSRIYFDRKNLSSAFNRGYNNIHAQRNPFDIFIYDFSDVPASAVDDQGDITSLDGVITTVLEQVWFESMDITFGAGDYVITENAGFWFEFIRSFKNGDPSQSASIGSPAFDDPIERIADTGRRGSLDARGLNRLGDVFADLLDV